MPMKIEFINASYPLILEDMIEFMEGQGFTVTTYMPEQDDTGTGEPEDTPDEAPKKSPKKTAKKAPEPKLEKEPEPETDAGSDGEAEMDGAAAKGQAIDILMRMYNDGKTSAVKELLTEFDVKKFGELPDERGNDLLKRAMEMDDAA